MRELDIRAIYRSKWIKTTVDSDFSTNLENLVKREFDTDKPNSVWVTDITYITYIWTYTGFVYLTSVMDLDKKEYTSEIIREFRTKTMFNNHWMKPYIVPIISIPNLDEYLKTVGYPIDVSSKAKSYQKVFPGDNGDYKAFQEVYERLRGAKTNNSNLIELIDYLNEIYLQKSSNN